MMSFQTRQTLIEGMLNTAGILEAVTQGDQNKERELGGVIFTLVNRAAASERRASCDEQRRT
jgi:hypothetical protein